MLKRSLLLRQAWMYVRTSGFGIRRQSAFLACQAVTLLFACAMVLPAHAQGRRQSALDQQSRNEAIDSIPFDELTEETQAKLWKVVSKPSIYRQLPVTVTDTDPDMHVFLVRYPEVVVNMWQLMGVTKVQMKRTGDYEFKATDGAGTVCDVKLVYGDQNTHVYYATGSYEGALLRKLIRGSCVMVLKSDYARTQDQRVYATNRLDMFVQLDNVGAEILAKTLHPLVGKSADHNFTESTRFLSQVSQAAETRATGLQQLADRLTNVDEPIREQFAKLATEVNHRSSLRNAGQQVWGDTVQAAPITTVPVVTTGPVMQGANELFGASSRRKPLNLRR